MDEFLWILCQSADDIAEREQTLVDADSFFQGASSCTGSLCSLAACQIDEVELCDHELFGALTGLLTVWPVKILYDMLFNSYCENGVRSWTTVVH